MKRGNGELTRLKEMAFMYRTIVDDEHNSNDRCLMAENDLMEAAYKYAERVERCSPGFYPQKAVE